MESIELVCPTCRTRHRSEPHAVWLPFCSQRCRWVDLGKWLKEEQAVPHIPDPEDDELPPEEMSQRDQGDL